MQESNKRKIQDRIEIQDVDDFDYDGFQVVRGEFFAHITEPCFVFSNNKVYVNTACIRKMPETEYIQILVNPDEKKLCVRPSEESVKDSFRWSGKDKTKPKQISCKIFFAKVYSLMGWDFNSRYKLLGKLIRSNDELLYGFDLKTPEIFAKRNINGVLKNSRTPAYPEDWKDHFGLSVKEHQKNLQVNIFNGYAVFGLQEEDRRENGER